MLTMHTSNYMIRYTQFDKHIARRYDGMSGGRDYITVCYLYYDGVLTDEDIREFDRSQEVFSKLNDMSYTEYSCSRLTFKICLFYQKKLEI